MRIISLVSMCLLSPCVAQQARQHADEQLYLLAATPTQESYSTPVTLYSIGAAKKLLTVRVIEPAGADGSVRVVPAKHAIYLIHPTDVIAPDPESAKIQHPKMVTILKFDDPLQAHDVAINPNGSFGDWYTTMAAAPTPLSEELLLPLQSPAQNHTMLTQELTGVKENSNGKYESVVPEDWNAYVNLRLEGMSGGPLAPMWIPEAKVSGVHVVLWRLGNAEQHPIPIASVPTELKGQSGKSTLSILASSDKYLVLSLNCDNGNNVDVPCESHDLFVLNRQSNEWKTIPTMGSGGVRLFGSWLTINVTLNMHAWKLVHQPQIEKDGDEGRLVFWLNPGVLLMHNLDDGREFGLSTNREDSEILGVKDGSLFYRVEDAIYRAKIYPYGVLQSTLLVKGRDVPTIHWLFWSTKSLSEATNKAKH